MQIKLGLARLRETHKDPYDIQSTHQPSSNNWRPCAIQWPNMLCWLDELTSLTVCEEIVVFCSIKVDERCLIRGSERKQNLKDCRLRR